MHKLQIDQIQEGINWIAADTKETNTAESYRLEKKPTQVKQKLSINCNI